MHLQHENNSYRKNDNDKATNDSASLSQSHLHLGRLLQLTQKLQASLIPQQQLEIFFYGIQFQVPVDGLSFDRQTSDQQKFNTIISIGAQERHRCHYNLVMDGKILGKLEFSRKQKFQADEINRLETLVAFLALPIRNTLLYQEAMTHAMTDTLTGVGNRASLNETLDRELKLAKRHQYQLSMLLIDVDYFKSINDKHGHQFGDAALKTIAEAIRAMTRDTDRIFRFGGDEFVVLLDNTDECRARLVSERIRMHIENISRTELSVTIGTATLLPDDTQETLFARADSALYRAKQRGRNCVEASLVNQTSNYQNAFVRV